MESYGSIALSVIGNETTGEAPPQFRRFESPRFHLTLFPGILSSTLSKFSTDKVDDKVRGTKSAAS